MNPGRPERHAKPYKHVYEYGGFEVDRDCGICGCQENDPIHLNLWRFMGGPDQPPILLGHGGLFKFLTIMWNGNAVYENRSGDKVRRHYLDRDLFRRMGQPEYIKLEVQIAIASGAVVF